MLSLYGGLLGLTWWQFQRAPSGFIPQQDKGYLLLNVQLPDSASVERTEQVMAHIGLWPRTPRESRTRSASAGQSLILDANAPNLGSMYILLEPFDRRHDPSRRADAIAKVLLDRCHEEVRRPSSRPSARRHRRPRYHRRLQADHRGPRQPWPGPVAAVLRPDRRPGRRHPA